MIVAYFETCHNGVEGEQWPIWWHDDLCISGNQTLEKLYVHDLNVLMCNREGLAEGNDNGESESQTQFRGKLANYEARLNVMYGDRASHRRFDAPESCV